MNWVAEQLSDNLSATHSSITIDTDTTDLSVPTDLSLNGTVLRLSRGGGQGVLSADLSSIAGGGSTPVTIEVQEDGTSRVSNAATLNFTDNVTVTGSGTTATIAVDVERPTFNIQDGGSLVSNGGNAAVNTINFTDNLTAEVSSNGQVLTVSAAGGSGGGSGTVNQVDSISNPTQIVTEENLTAAGVGNTARLYSSLDIDSDGSDITDATTLDVIDGLRTEQSLSLIHI